MARCLRQTTQKKYLWRLSPPYPANRCCGQIRRGNDRRRYVSVPDRRGICRWQLTRTASKRWPQRRPRRLRVGARALRR